CHVSRAAERLFVTQSAVSRQLTQLRALFDDQLLIRDGNRLIPTSKAIQLRPRVAAIIAGCDDLLSSDEFVPSQWQGPIALASSDYVAQYILPEIVERVQKSAPNLNLSYQLWSPEKLPLLADLDVQLVSTMLPAIPDGLCGAHIGADYPVCVMCNNHPLANVDELSVGQLVQFPHMRVSAGGDKDSFIDHELKALGLSRHVQLSVPFFSSAFEALCRTDMLMVIPEHIAVNMQAILPIVSKPLPIPVPEHRYWLIWHPKFDADPAHTWFREQVLNVMQSSMYSISQVDRLKGMI
ncbi:LysR family transcriptional regulator, partial [Photobacterium sanctipauli]